MNGREIVSNEENGGRGASHETLRLDLCIEQLHSPSLMRLWRTGCAELLHTAKEDEDLDPAHLNLHDGEFARSKDLTVALWIQYQTCNSETALREAILLL